MLTWLKRILMSPSFDRNPDFTHSCLNSCRKTNYSQLINHLLSNQRLYLNLLCSAQVNGDSLYNSLANIYTSKLTGVSISDQQEKAKAHLESDGTVPVIVHALKGGRVVLHSSLIVRVLVHIWSGTNLNNRWYCFIIIKWFLLFQTIEKLQNTNSD